MRKLAKKGSKPLLILVLLAVTVFAVGAALIEYWTSDPITKQMTTYTVLGMDAYIINTEETSAAMVVNYEGPIIATAFDGGSTGSVLLLFDDTNIDLTPGLVVSFDATVIGDLPVTVSLIEVRYMTLYYDSGSLGQFTYSDLGAPIIIDDTITIPVGDIPWITYDDPVPTYDTAVEAQAVGNALKLKFDFSPNPPSEWGDYSSIIDVVIKLSVDDGIP